MRNDPNVQLMKISFQTLLEFDEPFPIRRRIPHVREQTDQVVFVSISLILPDSAYSLRLEGRRAELLPKRNHHFAHQLLRDQSPIVKPQRQQDLVAAHTPSRN